VGDTAAEAWALHELGTLEAARGRVTAADELLDRARELFDEAGNHTDMEVSAHNLARLRGEPVAPLTPGPPGRGPLFTGKRLLGGGAAGAGAAALVIALGGGAEARVVGFVAHQDLELGITFDERRGWTVPDEATAPGGTLSACEPLYLTPFVEFEGMKSGQRWSLEAIVGDEEFATHGARWSGSSTQTEGANFFHNDDPEATESSGDPLPTGRWEVVVRVDDEELDRAVVTLADAC
jgi:hypothetical protein